MKSPLNEFREIYYKSGLSMLFHEYIQKTILIIGTVFSIALISTYFIHAYLFKLTGSRLFLSIGALTFIITIMTAFFLIFYPFYKKNELTTKTNEGLLHSLSYMAVLSTSGLGIENIMERVAEVEKNPSLKLLSTKFIMNIRLFGMDIISSLKDICNRSASEPFSNLIESIINNIQTSGELKNLFQFEIDRLMQKKRDEMKKMLFNLSNLGELYVALLIVAPILFILILIILSILGSSSVGSSALQLNVITFLGIPIVATGFIIILDVTIGGIE